MTKYKYSVIGMHCQGCADYIQNNLNLNKHLSRVKVNLITKTASFYSSQKPILKQLNEDFINQKKVYRLEPYHWKTTDIVRFIFLNGIKKYGLQTILLSSLALMSLIMITYFNFSLMDSMRFYMGGFFIIFASFKFINLKEFANSFSAYDPLAQKSRLYALAYPFIEILLGIGYLSNYNHTLINYLTFSIMLISTIGVSNALSQGKRIQCACLGTIFNLPLSYLTLFENIVMVIMALYMILVHN